MSCAVGLLIGTSFLGGGPSTDAGGRVSSLCFCTFADQRSQTPSPANTKLRDDQQSATQARSEIVAPLAPLAHTLSRRRCLPAASLRVRPAPPRRLLAPSAGTQPTQAPRCTRASSNHNRPRTARRNNTTHTHTHNHNPRLLQSFWGHHHLGQPHRQLSPRQRSPPCLCPLRSSTPQCAPSTRAAAKQYVPRVAAHAHAHAHGSRDHREANEPLSAAKASSGDTEPGRLSTRPARAVRCNALTAP